jgi:hypothetical protein
MGLKNMIQFATNADICKNMRYGQFGPDGSAASASPLQSGFENSLERSQVSPDYRCLKILPPKYSTPGPWRMLGGIEI